MKTNFVINLRVFLFGTMAIVGAAAGLQLAARPAAAADLFDKLKRQFSKPDADESAAGAKPGKPMNATQEKAKTAAIGTEMAKGRMQERAGEWEKARTTYQGVIKKYPTEPDAYHRLGIVADQQRRFTEAQENFTTALRMKPRDAEIHNDLGYSFFLQGKLDKAESSLQKATQIDPKNSRYRNNLGLVLGHKGKYPEAYAEFSKGGSEADAFYNLAFIYAAKDEADKAKECFRRAIAMNPKHDLARKALQSFELYDATGRDNRDLDTLSSKGNFVPFQEGSEKSSGGGSNAPSNVKTIVDPAVQRASYSEAVSAIPNRQVGSATRAAHNDAKGMLNRNMSSKRDSAPPANSP